MPRVTRRDFLSSGALATLGLAASDLRPTLAWADPLGLPVGLELYTVRNECQKDLMGTLKQVAETGYKAVEMGFPFQNKTAAELRKILGEFGLVCPSMHFPSVEKSAWEKHIEFAREAGLEYAVSPGAPSSDIKSLDDWRRMADRYNALGGMCRKAGIQLGYHNHNWEYRKYDGVAGYDEFLRRTDPALVKMQMDCFWTTYAGQDPVEYLTRHPGRTTTLHIKDLKPGFGPSTERIQGNPFTEVGRGVIDWKRIFQAATTGGVKFYFVEQDMWDGPPIESMKTSYEYLHQLNV